MNTLEDEIADFGGKKRRGVILQEFQGLNSTDIDNYQPDDLLLFKRTLATLKTKKFKEKENFTEFFQSIKQNSVFYEEFNTVRLENELNKIHFDAIRSSIPEFILFIYLFLAKIYYALADYTKSREYSKKGIVLGFQINFPKISTKVYKRLIKICLKKKNYKNAASYCTKLLYFSWFLNNKELEIEVYDKLGLILYYLGKTKEAKYYHDLNCLGKVQPKNSENRKFGTKKIVEKIQKYRAKDTLEAYRIVESSFEDYEVIIPQEVAKHKSNSDKIMNTHLSLNRDVDQFAEYENWQVINNNKNLKYHGINYGDKLLKKLKKKIKAFSFKLINMQKFLIDNKVMSSYDNEMKKANELQSMVNLSENVLMMRMAREHNKKATGIWK